MGALLPEAQREMQSISDKITIHFVDGSYDDREFGFTNWVENSLCYDNAVVWKGKFSNPAEKEEGPASLYLAEVLINNNNPIVEIELPFLPNIHVFAISII